MGIGFGEVYQEEAEVEFIPNLISMCSNHYIICKLYMSLDESIFGGIGLVNLLMIDPDISLFMGFINQETQLATANLVVIWCS